MRSAHGVTFAVLVAVLLVSSAASATWTADTSPYGPGWSSVACGDLAGGVGDAWGTMTGSIAEDGKSVDFSGDVGVKWYGEEPDSGSQSPAPQYKDNFIQANFKFDSGSPATSWAVDLSTSGSSGGSAMQSHNPPEPFAWSWSGLVTQDEPSMYMWIPGTGWSSSGTFDPATVTQDTPGMVSGGASNGGASVSSSTTSGSFSAAGSLPQGTSIRKLMFTVFFTSEAINASASNTKIVTPNFISLTFSFTASVT